MKVFEKVMFLDYIDLTVIFLINNSAANIDKIFKIVSTYGAIVWHLYIKKYHQIYCIFVFAIQIEKQKWKEIINL